MLLGRNYHETVVHMDPYEEITSFGGPVLLIQGMKDSVVDYHYALKARKAYQPDQCQLQLVKNAGHGFDEMQTKSVLASIEQFLLNKKEVLTIQVAITGHEIRKEDDDFKQIAAFLADTLGHRLNGGLFASQDLQRLVESLGHFFDNAFQVPTDLFGAVFYVLLDLGGQMCHLVQDFLRLT